MNTLPHPLTSDWQDFEPDYGMQEHLDRERKADLASDWGIADRNEGAELGWVQMQGRNAWPARRCSPELVHFIDRMPEEYDDQTESADREVMAWLGKGVLFVLFVFVIGALIDDPRTLAEMVKEWLS